MNDLALNFIKDAEKLFSTSVAYDMYFEEIPLGTYRKNGIIYTEVTQCAPWSSGPIIFTCLKDDLGNLYYLWEEVNKYPYNNNNNNDDDNTSYTYESYIDKEKGHYWI